MASKKSAKKKSSAKGKKKAHDSKCNDAEICKFLADLSAWLKWFNEDYKKLRKAVCNVERQAFGDGTALPNLRFCTGGPAAEPNDPTPPPKWT